MSLKDDINETKKQFTKIIKENKDKSLALEMLRDSKRKIKMMYVYSITVSILLLMSFCYIVYIIRDIEDVKITTTLDAKDGTNNYIGNDGDIRNG